MNKKLSVLGIIFAMILSMISMPLQNVVEATDGGSLTIHKYEVPPGTDTGPAGNGTADDAENVPSDAIPVEGVSYTITQTHAYDANTGNMDPLAAPLVISTEGFETGPDGTVTFNLPLGVFDVVEAHGPDHIVLSEDVFTVELPYTSPNGSELIYDVHMFPKNEAIKADVYFNKLFEGSEGQLGASFELYKVGSEEDSLIATLSPDETGLVKVDNLDYGSYYFKEVSTHGDYELGGTIDFEINTETVTATDEGYEFNLNTILEDESYVNYKKVTLEKSIIDEDGNYVEARNINRDTEFQYVLDMTLPGNVNDYESLRLVDELDGNLEFISLDSVVIGGMEMVGSFGETFADGVLTIDMTSMIGDLPEGGDMKVIFKAKISDDYLLNDPIYNDATTFYNNGLMDGQVDSNEVSVTPTDGALEVIKVDPDGNRLNGAEFKITDMDGNTISIGGNALDNLKTEGDGTFIIEDLPLGEYKLHETKAPTYVDEDGITKSYRLLQSPQDFEVKVSGETVQVTVENTRSAWYLPETGGIGTILFTVIGLLMMIGASLSLIIRKHRRGV